MPHLVSPAVRDEKDKAGHVCKVVDIIWNTWNPNPNPNPNPNQGGGHRLPHLEP